MRASKRKPLVQFHTMERQLFVTMSIGEALSIVAACEQHDVTRDIAKQLRAAIEAAPEDGS